MTGRGPGYVHFYRLNVVHRVAKKNLYQWQIKKVSEFGKEEDMIGMVLRLRLGLNIII